MKNRATFFNKGFGLVEAVIAISIIASFIVVLAAVNNIYLQVALENQAPSKASFMIEEGMEALRYMRDESWNNRIQPLSLGSDYYLLFQEDHWEATTLPQITDGFTRTFSLSEVYRDGSDNIAEAGVLDPDTRLILVRVSWATKNGLETRELKGYIARIFDED